MIDGAQSISGGLPYAWSYSVTWTMAPGNIYVLWCHNKGSNALFLDGHGSWVAQDSLSNAVNLYPK